MCDLTQGAGTIVCRQPSCCFSQQPQQTSGAGDMPATRLVAPSLRCSQDDAQMPAHEFLKCRLVCKLQVLHPPVLGSSQVKVMLSSLSSGRWKACRMASVNCRYPAQT